MFDKIQFLTSQMWTFLRPFVKILMSQAGPILANAAMKAVAAAASSAMDSSEKRGYAFSVITDDLKSQGISLGTSIINMAIEAAVVKMKEKG